MKRLIVIVFFMSLVGCATAPAEKLRSSNVIELPGMKKDQIFTKSLQWVATTFRSANTVTQYKDQKEGKIVLQMVTETFAYMTSMTFHTSITIDIKDNKSRLSFEAHDISKSGTAYQEIYDSEAEFAQKSYISVISSYKAYMTGSSTKKDDNW